MMIRTLKQVAQNRELRMIPLKMTLQAHDILLFISLLKIEDKASGWVIAMADVGI
ncbi:MAG: hypothetical protein ABII26_07675 [Pseudomonadota bacterium]